jgi:hypothetical protein
VSSSQDQARLIARRVARRLGNDPSAPIVPEPTPLNGVDIAPEQPRARIIDFISSGPPVRSKSSVVAPPASVEQPSQASSKTSSEFFQFIPATQSPWLGRLPAMLANQNPHSVDHPSQQRFGVEEATVAELVEFFEKEKKCSVDPSGKPCDHCAMCNSRGF